MSEFPNWFKITGEANFKALIPKDMRENPALKALQIGTYTGDATAWLHKNTAWDIHDVDTWQGSQEVGHETIKFSDVEKYYDKRHKDKMRVTKYKMTSDEFFSEEPLNTYDFVYVDGDHTATQTIKDGLNAFMYLNPGGIIVFDDFTWSSGKGKYFDPRPGIEAFHHICSDLVEVLVANSQAWFKKV
jgi:predicted O-methyltransferase YrrM